MRCVFDNKLTPFISGNGFGCNVMYLYFSLLNLSFVANCHKSTFTAFESQHWSIDYQIPLIVISRQPKFQRLWALMIIDTFYLNVEKKCHTLSIWHNLSSDGLEARHQYKPTSLMRGDYLHFLPRLPKSSSLLKKSLQHPMKFIPKSLNKVPNMSIGGHFV